MAITTMLKTTILCELAWVPLNLLQNLHNIPGWWGHSRGPIQKNVSYTEILNKLIANSGPSSNHMHQLFNMLRHLTDYSHLHMKQHYFTKPSIPWNCRHPDWHLPTDSSCNFAVPNVKIYKLTYPTLVSHVLKYLIQKLIIKMTP
jgi:hypothetical protein